MTDPVLRRGRTSGGQTKSNGESKKQDAGIESVTELSGHE
jgi:hypothetical protein